MENYGDLPRLFSNGLSWRGEFLDLSRKPITYKLFKVIFNGNGVSPNIDELVEEVYNVELDKLSDRMRQSLKHNLIKLVSRSRVLVQASFGQSALGWLAYDPVYQNYRIEAVN